MKSRTFWIRYRAALIQQYRTLAGGEALPAAFTDAQLRLIRAVEEHAGLEPFDPLILTRAERARARG